MIFGIERIRSGLENRRAGAVVDDVYSLFAATRANRGRGYSSLGDVSCESIVGGRQVVIHGSYEEEGDTIWTVTQVYPTGDGRSSTLRAQMKRYGTDPSGGATDTPIEEKVYDQITGERSLALGRVASVVSEALETVRDGRTTLV